MGARSPRSLWRSRSQLRGWTASRSGPPSQWGRSRSSPGIEPSRTTGRCGPSRPAGSRRQPQCRCSGSGPTSRGRLRAVMLAGVTGYGVAVLFLLHGAPDLALTQVLVETVTLVVFALVLRKLPKYFTSRPLHASRWWRLVVAVAVGATVSTIAAVAAGARVAAPISEAFYEAAYTFGYGRNIVNVTLVDIRAWDTMGEISVLVVAATGVASLIFIRSRYSDSPVRRPAGPTAPRPAGHEGPDDLAARRRDAVADPPLDHLRGGHPGAVPGDDRGLGLPADRRAQRPGRRVRRRAGGRHGVDDPLPRRGWAGAGRGRPGRRRPGARGRAAAGRPERAGTVAVRWPDPAELRHQLRLRSAGRGGDATRAAHGARVAAPGHLGVLRHRGLPGGDRGDARPGPQPRRRHRPARGRGPDAPHPAPSCGRGADGSRHRGGAGVG